ncbi:hypothetical protein GGQ99_005125 [Aminobacter niigataensis]|uniref:Uncharacterized protein n=1 Tax=Aminobacter niigataensis TaxID=83265 RepID=A0ABR6L9C6_9HYPH|nr:hypothetical protein [Aminobacter niigataensis]MBB4653335.1 hypothetical protein [Aminobacter niigataensis]
MSDSNATLAALLENVEDEHEEGWGTVYLDNARLPSLSDAVFRSHLSALAKSGVYKPIDSYAFGAVCLSLQEAGLQVTHLESQRPLSHRDAIN